jgi:hypothetical protein
MNHQLHPRDVYPNHRQPFFPQEPRRHHTRQEPSPALLQPSAIPDGRHVALYPRPEIIQGRRCVSADQVVATSIPHVLERGISGWAAPGGQTYDPCLSSRDAFMDRCAACDPDENDQGAKQRRWSQISTGSQGDPPSLIASQHGMCSLDGRCLIERADDQRLRWSSAWWSPPPEWNGRPNPYHEPSGTAVQNAVSPGHARPSRPKLSVLFWRSYAFSSNYSPIGPGG